jgi:tRNA(Ile)-lysidine synthase
VAWLDPAVAAIRTAVADALAKNSDALPEDSDALPNDSTAQPLALVACSGGPDSMALADAAAFVAPRHGWRVGLITVDHGLQAGSAERADAVAAWAKEQGFAPAEVATVVVGTAGGPEAAARDARYEALVRAARAHGASIVLLGHTRDDQAETVLLALLRGAGLRGLAGMPSHRDLNDVTLCRPLLSVDRAQTRAACTARGLSVWDDPHNVDPAFARARVRTLLDSVVSALGPGVVANLARTASLAAADAEALDGLAAAAATDAAEPGGGLRVEALRALPAALRSRVLHAWARELGAPGAALSQRHVAALDALVTGWHGQGAVALPGAIMVVREDGMLRRVHEHRA